MKYNYKSIFATLFDWQFFTSQRSISSNSSQRQTCYKAWKHGPVFLNSCSREIHQLVNSRNRENFVKSDKISLFRVKGQLRALAQKKSGFRALSRSIFKISEALWGTWLRIRTQYTAFPKFRANRCREKKVHLVNKSPMAAPKSSWHLNDWN